MDLSRYTVDELYGCHLWAGEVDEAGYGWRWIGPGKKGWVHRLAWEAVHGVIAENRVIDHVCRRRNCIRLEHLELVTPEENQRRKRWAYRSQIKKCPKGHDLWRHGRRTPEAGVICRLCCGL